MTTTTYKVCLEILLAEIGVSDVELHPLNNSGPAGSSCHILSVVRENPAVYNKPSSHLTTKDHGDSFTNPIQH